MNHQKSTFGQCALCLNQQQGQIILVNEFKYCRECFIAHIIQRLNKLEVPLCPQGKNMDEEIFMPLLSNELKERYKKAIAIRIIQEAHLLRCPKECDPNGVIVEFIDAFQQEGLRCTWCETRFCKTCRQEQHDGKCDLTVLQGLIKNFGIAICQKCQRGVERNEGCNKIICKCDYWFCYFCWDQFQNYSHKCKQQQMRYKTIKLKEMITEIEKEKNIRIQKQQQVGENKSNLKNNEEPVQRVQNTSKQEFVSDEKLLVRSQKINADIQEQQNASTIPITKIQDSTPKYQQRPNEQSAQKVEKQVIFFKLFRVCSKIVKTQNPSCFFAGPLKYFYAFLYIVLVFLPLSILAMILMGAYLVAYLTVGFFILCWICMNRVISNLCWNSKILKWLFISLGTISLLFLILLPYVLFLICCKCQIRQIMEEVLYLEKPKLILQAEV